MPDGKVRAWAGGYNCLRQQELYDDNLTNDTFTTSLVVDGSPHGAAPAGIHAPEPGHGPSSLRRPIFPTGRSDPGDLRRRLVRGTRCHRIPPSADPGYSLRAVSGPVIRRSSGIVAPMMASAALRPPITTR
ncbi:hypothetical protein GCM10010195_26770 [Kitasatospora griseola]|nr:hypothetical protein GCM10010195_26770 [Kitasatospora griseola]